MYVTLAWRNVWRNPRRTIVILCAIVIGVWCMLVLGGFTRGAETGMIRNGIATLTGHIQIHARGYREDPVIQNYIRDLSALERDIETHLPPDSLWTSRIQIQTFARNARHMAPITLVGINPDKEKGLSFIGDGVIEGHQLQGDDPYGLIVGQALLDQFDTKIGHKLIFSSPDTDHEIVSKAFYIAGIFRAELEATEKQYAFITMPAVRGLLGLEGGASEVSIVLSDPADVKQVAEELAAALPADRFEVRTWKESLPLLRAYLIIFDGFLLIWYLVVFVAMGFGIANTTLMAIFERIREFGLLHSLGMKPAQIITTVLTESLLLLVCGLVIGDALGLLTVLGLSSTGINLSAFAEGAEYLGFSRVIYPVVHLTDLLIANLVVLLLGLLVSIYPAVKAARFTPVEALAHT